MSYIVSSCSQSAPIEVHDVTSSYVTSSMPVSFSTQLTKNLLSPNTILKNSIINSNNNFAKSTSLTQMSGSNRFEINAKLANDLMSLRNDYLHTPQQQHQPFVQQNFLSEIESAMMRSSNPIELNETDEIIVNGQRGIWANKAEVASWRGLMPIEEYDVNQDPMPEIITKKTNQQIEYVQELAIRYLRPPTPPQPGEIIINQCPNVLTPPAPPIIVRQQPARPATPEPMVIREAPPAPPPSLGRKIITISGKRLPPPPRKVVIERLPQLPTKPQAVIVERWLPYAEVKRRVIFNKPTEKDPIIVKPRNVIIQWETPHVNIKKEYKYLGVIRANPFEYVQRYGPALVPSHSLPNFVSDIKTPDGLVLAANHNPGQSHELYGDVHALSYIDLDREGLGEYKHYVQPTQSYHNVSYHERTSPGLVSNKQQKVSIAPSPVQQTYVYTEPDTNTSSQSQESNNPGLSLETFHSYLPYSVVQSDSGETIATSMSAANFSSIIPQSQYGCEAPTHSSSYDGYAAYEAPNTTYNTHSSHYDPNSSADVTLNFDHLNQSTLDRILNQAQMVTEKQAIATTTDLPQLSYVVNPSATSLNSTKSHRQLPKSMSSNSFSRRSVTNTFMSKAASPPPLPPQQSSSSASASSMSAMIENIFRSIDRHNVGKISIEDAEKVLLRLNSRLGRRYGEDDLKAFFNALDLNMDGLLDLDEFRRAFTGLSI